MTTRALGWLMEPLSRYPEQGRSVSSAYRSGGRAKELIKRVYMNVLGRSLAMTSCQP